MSKFEVEENTFNITLPKDFTGKLTIEKGQIVEKKEEILNQEEREYLRAIVKPFRKKYHTYISRATQAISLRKYMLLCYLLFGFISVLSSVFEQYLDLSFMF